MNILLIEKPKPIHIFTAGMILAIGFFIRAANINNFLATIFYLAFTSKNRIKNPLTAISGFLLIIIPYQLFSILKFHEIFPSYWIMAKNQDIAAFLYGGVYKNQIPVLEILNKPTTIALLPNILHHLWGGLKQIIYELPLLLPFVCLQIYFSIKNKIRIQLLLLIIAMTNLFLYAFEHYNITTEVVALRRYSLMITPFLIPLGINMLFYLKTFLKEKNNIYTKTVIYPTIIISLALPIQAVKKLNNYALESIPKQQEILEEETYLAGWITQNTSSNQRIAVSGYINPLLIKNPIINAPRYKLLNKENLDTFIKIFRPTYLITTRTTASDDREKLKKHLKEVNTLKKLNYFQIFYLKK